jgi:hypothetical protein
MDCQIYQIWLIISFLGLNAYRGISPFDMPFQRYDKLQVCIVMQTYPYFTEEKGEQIYG